MSMLEILLRVVGVGLLAVFFLVTFLYEEFIMLDKIEEEVLKRGGGSESRSIAERKLRFRKLMLSLIYIIGLILATLNLS